MKLSSETKELIAFASVILLVVLAFSYYFFNITGIRVVLGIILMSLPFYLIIGNFNVPEGEKFVFSLLLGLTLFPSFAYLLGLIISFKISIIVVFIELVIAAFIFMKYKKKKYLRH